MLICPVCRSQNMDAAKFCGNCGNSFPRPSTPTSSLINCPQGHIYSAVYEHCPYCPLPESGQESDFITRVEEPITTVDPPNPMTTTPKPSPVDFITLVEPGQPLDESLIETAESPIVIPPADSSPPPAYAPTEMITTAPPWETAGASDVASFRIPEPDAQPVLELVQPELQEPAPPPPPPQAPMTASEFDRRTIVMAEQSSQLRRSKGRIVGWLITYSRNPDGEDFRIYAGYNRLGANPVCDIVLEDETVSGSHSIIVYRDGRCLIKDDLSRNGTFVNGREITESHPLQSYDQIRIGNTYLTFVAAQQLGSYDQ